MSDADESETETGDTAEPDLRYGVAWSESAGQLVLHPSLDEYIATAQALRDDGFVSAVDLCGVDYLTHRVRRLPAGVTAERFEVVVNLVAHDPPRRARVRVQVPESDPTVPTLFDIFPGVEFAEREAFDMFGIVFADHPDPTRILMPHDWQGHPLRKDFGVGAVPVQFKGAPAAR